MILMTRTQLCYRKVKTAPDSADMNGAVAVSQEIVYKNRWLAGFGLWARLGKLPTIGLGCLSISVLFFRIIANAH